MNQTRERSPLRGDIPRCYISVTDDKRSGTVILLGRPMNESIIPIERARLYCEELGGRVDIAWQGSAGKWVSL